MRASVLLFNIKKDNINRFKNSAVITKKPAVTKQRDRNDELKQFKPNINKQKD